MRPVRPSTDNRITPGRVVEYQQHGKSRLAVVLLEKKNKWVLVNQDGTELELSADRLYLFPGAVPEAAQTTSEKAKFLNALCEEAQVASTTIALEEIWELLREQKKEVTIKDITEIAFEKDELETRLATRLCIVSDQIFFKRKKNGSFEPRSATAVEELRIQRKVEQEKREKQEKLITSIVEGLLNKTPPDPATLEPIEQLAVLGKSADQAKQTTEMLEEVVKRAKRSYPAQGAERAFRILVDLGHFTPHQHLTPIRLGRPIRFTQAELDAAAALAEQSPQDTSNRSRFTAAAVFTIDGAESRDFDDALSLERTEAGFRVGVHISDVAALVERHSEVEAIAFRRGTSIYCPDIQYPMLPKSLSEELLSLKEGHDRAAMSFFIDFDKQYKIVKREVQRTTVHIDKRLTYDEADRMLCDGEGRDTPYHDILMQLWDIAKAYEHSRVESGATQFTRRDKSPSVVDGVVTLLEPTVEDTPSRQLIGEFMILANETAACTARDNDIPVIFRAQEAPEVELSEQGHHIPPGPARDFFQRSFFKRSTLQFQPGWHFGLGLPAYAQITSPIRRAFDLVNQRQLAAHIDGTPLPYDEGAIEEVLGQIEQGLDEAFQIQRERTRYWLLQYLVQENIKELDAIVMKNDGPRPLVEIEHLYSLFFMHTASGSSPQLGDKVRVQIESINPRKDSFVLREIK